MRTDGQRKAYTISLRLRRGGGGGGKKFLPYSVFFSQSYRVKSGKFGHQVIRTHICKQWKSR